MSDLSNVVPEPRQRTNADLIAQARALRSGYDRAKAFGVSPDPWQAYDHIVRLADALETAEATINSELIVRDAALAENERLRDGAALVAAATPCACSAQRSRAEQAEAENERLRGFGARIRAFARDNVLHGDMTPMAERMWGRIADELDGGSDDRE